MLDAADRLKRVQRIGAANQYRRSNGKPRRKRSEGTGEACILLRAVAVREFIPTLDPDVLKFWLIAASYADSMGVAWAAQKEFIQYGYNATKTSRMFELLDSLGLIRWIRKGAKDPVTRRALFNVYQFHPALLYVRKAMRPQAAALSTTPFESHFQKPILESRENLKGKQVLENPILQTKTKDPRPQTNEVQETPFYGEKPEPRIDQHTARSTSEPQNDESTSTNQRASAPKNQSHSASARKRTETPPPPTPSAPSAGSEFYRAPLDNESHERIADKLHALTGSMSLSTARYLVTRYGESPCSDAIAIYCQQGVGTVGNPAGFIRKLIERNAIKSNPHTAALESKIITADEWWMTGKQENKSWQTR